MLLAYTLELRSSWWVLVFALACVASSLYGFLAGTWPFGIVEGIWALVALRRWLNHAFAGLDTLGDRLGAGVR